jgi:oligoribonuclease NrnB/cAMP/cGMP phosphodiesterase (DHH superfamily)
VRYVLYHSNCYDGFGAAYAAWKKFGDEGTKYLPVSYGFPPPEMPDAKAVYIVDFSYPKETILALAEKCPVTVLDHHKTAKEALEPLVGQDNPTVIFDMERSGAKMTWEYLNAAKPTPALIEHISDRDLWRFRLEGSKAVHKALVSYPMDFKVWDTFDIQKLKVEGEALERLHAQLVANICKAAWTGEIDGHKVPMVNTSIAWSEVGHELLQRFPEAPFVASFTVFDTQVMWSLRSRPGFDVSAVAKKFGGGGHENAAGFKTVRF